MAKRKVIIDCDTGTDDAVAIIGALGSKEIDVQAITTVNGNVDLEYTSKNTLDLVDALGIDVPVAKGAEGPLYRDITQLRQTEEKDITLYSHGAKGFGNVVLTPSQRPFYSKNALVTIHDFAEKDNGELELIVTGPMTNIALALEVYPDLKKLIKHIYFMGGAMYGGNSTAVAEFNIFFDPEAAYTVLHSGIPLTEVGLDVTEKTILTDDDIDVIKGIENDAGRIGGKLLDFMRDRRDKGGEDVFMHDPLAVAAAVAPSVVQTTPYFVDVELAGKYTYGHTYVQKNKRLSNEPVNCDVATSVNVRSFVHWLTSAINNYSE